MTKEEKKRLNAKIDSVIAESDYWFLNEVRYVQIEPGSRDGMPGAHVRVSYMDISQDLIYSHVFIPLKKKLYAGLNSVIAESDKKYLNEVRDVRIVYCGGIISKLDTYRYRNKAMNARIKFGFMTEGAPGTYVTVRYCEEPYYSVFIPFNEEEGK